MLHGSFWMILLRWTIRLTGLVSTVILARLLTPADFGIVAMAMVVVAMLEVFNQTGQKLAIIRIEDPTTEHYNSVWTVSFILGLVIAVSILIAAPFSQFYFHEPRAVPVMQCLALRAALSGLENAGSVDFRRDLKYHIFFLYNVVPKLVSFVVTIVLAYAWRNYWALVVGILVNQLALTVFSYVIHPHRPRFSFKKTGDIWSFSIWTFIRSIGVYMNQQIDRIVIGGISGAPAMGRYAVGADVATSPSREINDPMIAVLFPVMARLQGDQAQLRAIYLRTVEWSALICLSSSVGVALVAQQMVPVVLGSKWIDIVPLMGWLSLAGGILGVSGATYTLFDALGKPYISARMQWFRVIMLMLAIIPTGIITRSLVAIAIVRLIVIVIFVPTLFSAAGRLVGISMIDYVKVIWRSAVAAIAMAIAVLAFDLSVTASDAVELFAKILLGAAVYSSALWALWVASGRPPSAEQDILAQIEKYARLLFPRRAVKT